MLGLAASLAFGRTSRRIAVLLAVLLAAPAFATTAPAYEPRPSDVAGDLRVVLTVRGPSIVAITLVAEDLFTAQGGVEATHEALYACLTGSVCVADRFASDARLDGGPIVVSGAAWCRENDGPIHIAQSIGCERGDEARRAADLLLSLLGVEPSALGPRTTEVRVDRAADGVTTLILRLRFGDEPADPSSMKTWSAVSKRIARGSVRGLELAVRNDAIEFRWTQLVSRGGAPDVGAAEDVAFTCVLSGRTGSDVPALERIVDDWAFAQVTPDAVRRGEIPPPRDRIALRSGSLPRVLRGHPFQASAGDAAIYAHRVADAAAIVADVRALEDDLDRDSMRRGGLLAVLVDDAGTLEAARAVPCGLCGRDFADASPDCPIHRPRRAHPRRPPYFFRGRCVAVAALDTEVGNVLADSGATWVLAVHSRASVREKLEQWYAAEERAADSRRSGKSFDVLRGVMAAEARVFYAFQDEEFIRFDCALDVVDAMGEARARLGTAGASDRARAWFQVRLRTLESRRPPFGFPP